MKYTFLDICSVGKFGSASDMFRIFQVWASRFGYEMLLRKCLFYFF